MVEMMMTSVIHHEFLQLGLNLRTLIQKCKFSIQNNFGKRQLRLLIKSALLIPKLTLRSFVLNFPSVIWKYDNKRVTTTFACWIIKRQSKSCLEPRLFVIQYNREPLVTCIQLLYWQSVYEQKTVFLYSSVIWWYFLL